ncbi:hypothetical protein CR152_24540 [Massilia violaceinigra]|uniref:Uncharacterized protein n=1 Tax=Massilia violaceinigra TaxID=2045208 RepID=A0A2D2DQT2_9BURK|nr:hypothetical protein [Massilia violaceinigra]ATQ77332.1 hypothetical protein CR152_24540 [Massilia violaceinigra]
MEVYIGGRDLLWVELEQLVAELAMQLERAGFARVAPANTASAQQRVAPPSASLTDTLARWIGRRD